MKRAYDSEEEDTFEDYSSAEEDDDYDDESEDDEDDGAREEGRASFQWVEPTPVTYVSLDDRPMTLLRTTGSSSSTETDWPYFRTVPLSTQRDPFAHAGASAPHLGLTPHGTPVNSTLFNLRKAVEMGDSHHAAACLVSLFDLFVAMNRPTRTLVHCTDREVRLEMLPSIGPFANRNALAVHQGLWNILRTIFMDQIGVANCTALLQLEDLWLEYELFLFCDPYVSLAALLSIGQLLCRCYKDGSVLYAYDCWADTAKDRLWRAEALRDPRILAKAMCGEDRDRAKQMLSCENVYYTNRSRHMRYQQMALTNRHLQYILQGKTMKPKTVRAFVDQIRDEIAFYVEHSRSEPESTTAYAVLDMIESWCIYEYGKVNCLNGNRESETLQVKMLVFIQLLSECMMHPSVRGLGKDGLFATSNARVHSTLNVKVNFEYARRCRESLHEGLLLKYGLLSDGSVPILPARIVKRPKFAGATAPGGIVDLLNPTPPCIPRTHEALHPGLDLGADGVMLESPGAGMPRNRVVQQCFRYLYCMYYAKRNWKRLSRQVKSEGMASTEAKGGSSLTAVVRLDSTYFDFTRRHRKPKGGLLGQAVSYSLMELFLMHPPAGLDRAYGEDPRGSVKIGDFDDVGMAQLFMDALLATSQLGPSAVVLGPFPTVMRKELEERLAETTRAKQALDVQAASSTIVCLGLNQFPVNVRTCGKDMYKGNRALFVVHVPHQVHNLCFRISELKVQLERLGRKDAFGRICPPKALLPIVAYMEKYANRNSNMLPHDSYITFRLDFRTTPSRTHVVADHIRLSVVADDLTTHSTGIRMDVAERKDVPLEQHLQRFERAILQTQGKGEDLYRRMRELRNLLVR